MSFLKKLFGGGTTQSGPTILGQEEYNGFVIKAVEMRAGSEYQLSGVIEKEIGEETKTHQFIRADRLPSADMAASATLAKGRQIIDEQGDKIFI